MLVQSSLLLRRALGADVVVSAASALLMLLAAGPLAPWLGLPESLLRGVGLALLPYVAFVGWLASRSALPRALVIAVIATNALYATGCVELLLGGAVAPSALGRGFVLMQAGAVLLFAAAQWVGLTRSAASRG